MHAYLLHQGPSGRSAKGVCFRKPGRSYCPTAVSQKEILNLNKFAAATFDQVFTQQELSGAIEYSANNFKSIFIRNNGNGTFTMEPLPDMVQYSAINGMVTDDFDGDGNLDFCMSTNDYSTVPSYGRYDALNGLILRGDGKGKFTPLSIEQSGIFIPENGKALVKLRSSDGKYLIAASQNKGPLKLFALNRGYYFLPVNAGDVAAVITYKDGRRQRRDIGYGSSFLSQSGRFITVNGFVASIEITDSKGGKRIAYSPGYFTATVPGWKVRHECQNSW